MSSLAVRLSETTPTWGRAVAPIAEWVAQSLWASYRKTTRSDQMLPTRLTQSRRSAGRGKEFIVDTTPAPHPKNVCPAKRAWNSSPKVNWPDETVNLRQIQPRLATVTISAVASTLGISESYAADIRTGRHRPHPRHWQTLAKLVSAAKDA